MKRFLLISLALAGLISCAKQTTDLQSNNEITFRSSVEKKSATKSNTGIIDGTTFSYSDFGVYGYVSENNTAINGESSTTNGGYIAKNAKYVKSGAIWKPESGSYYWPKADVLSDISVNFVAYAPYANIDASFNSTDNTITIPVVATTMDTECVDVMYAHTETAVHPTSDPVDLTFTHALSWIEFQGKFSKNVKEVKITSIKFSTALKGSGDLVINVKNFSTPTFTNLSNNIEPDFCVNKVLAEQDPGDGTGSYEVLSDMLLIPQNVPAQITITFNITIENTTGDEIYYNGRTVTRTINGGADANKQENPANGRDFVSAFEGGKKYVYRVYVTADEITFDVDVDDWDADDNPFQIWDHNATAYVEHFFVGASNVMVKNSIIA